MGIIDYSWDFSKEDFNLDLDFFNEQEQEDKLWQARTGLNFETLCGAIETIIFMHDRPVNLQKIKNQIDADLPLRVVHDSIVRLQAEYEAKHHGIRLMEVAQGYQFRTKATYAKIVQKMFKVQSLQLSPTALEVMAIIAYKQPISKTAIESIRGVDSSHVVRSLMDRRLVKLVGRSDEMGRPSLYGTTAEFLEVFNLNRIEDLPSEIELEEIASANEVGQISDIKNIVQVGNKKKFDTDELLELDKLSSSIQQIVSDTLFTKSLKDMEKVRVNTEGVEKKSAFDILEEYVNKSQIIEQNKLAADSEVLTSVMEPIAICPKEMLEKVFNAPSHEEDDVDITIGSEQRVSGFEELDSSRVKEIEIQADIVLEQSEKLVKELVEYPQKALEVHTDSIEAEVDLAFDELIENGPEQVEEMDLSGFISDKLANSNAKGTNQSSEDDEAELAAALDQAFAKLNLKSENEQKAQRPDIDLEFLQSSFAEDEKRSFE